MPRKPKVKGSGPPPGKSDLHKMISSTKSGSPDANVSNYSLLTKTDTLKFYIDDKDKTIVVAIRGTKPTDTDDLYADARIAVGQLEGSDRFKRDLKKLEEVQSQYPPNVYDYYGVGYSLGGAILDLFLEKGLLKSGRSYNPAMQPQHGLAPSNPNEQLKNDRIYAENDPLYAVNRNFEFNGREPEVRPAKRSALDTAIGWIPYIGPSYDYLVGHRLDQFEGGYLTSI